METCGIWASIYTLALGLQMLLCITRSLKSTSFESQISYFRLRAFSLTFFPLSP